MSVIVLGAGISGLSASFHLNQKGISSKIFDKNSYAGGMCHSFTIDGFTFDQGAHLSFTSNEYVKSLFKKSTSVVTHRPTCSNYYKGTWIRHPAQNNLFPLPQGQKDLILESFKQRPALDLAQIGNYQEWLEAQYGHYFANEFPAVYTRKYWCLDPKDMCINWIGPRMNRPSLADLERGANSLTNENHYYIQEMRYPSHGGYKSFLNHLYHENQSLNLASKVIEWDADKRVLFFENGSQEHYEHVISSLPLPDIVKLIQNCPDAVKDAARALCHTSAHFVTIGLNKPQEGTDLWFYIYDEDLLASRVGRHSLKSPQNSRAGTSSFQFEIYNSNHKTIEKSKDQLIENTILTGRKLNLFSKDDILMVDVKFAKYANISFDLNIMKNRECVLDFLKSKSIRSIGRYGEWDYLWSDQSLLSGKKAAEALVKQIL